MKRDLTLENRSGSEVRTIRLAKTVASGGATSNFIGPGGGGRALELRTDRQELLRGRPVADGARGTVAVGDGFCAGPAFLPTQVTIELADGRVIEKTLDCAAGLTITPEDVAGARPPASPAPPPPRP